MNPGGGVAGEGGGGGGGVGGWVWGAGGGGGWGGGGGGGGVVVVDGFVWCRGRLYRWSVNVSWRRRRCCGRCVAGGGAVFLGAWGKYGVI